MDYQNAYNTAAHGAPIRRASWTPKRYVRFVSNSSGTTFANVYRPWFMVVGDAEDFPWTPSEQDMAATDWESVKPEDLVLDGPEVRPQG